MIHVVLCQPEIPQNTGNIMRSCIGMKAHLHLIKPLGFKIDDAKLRRSAVDYYDAIDYQIHESFEEFYQNHRGAYFFLTRYGVNKPCDIDFKALKEDIYLVFGSESFGIDRELLKKHLKQTYRFPISDQVRSLNLSNCVAMMLYEVYRQLDFKDLEPLEPSSLKGPDFLEKLNSSK